MCVYILADNGAQRQREQAEEGQYIKKREVEKLKEAKARLEQAQAEVVRVFSSRIRTRPTLSGGACPPIRPPPIEDDPHWARF
jgi:hypothetical protein